MEAFSTNEKATLNLWERVGFDRRLDSSSFDHDNDNYKILKFINKFKYIFTDINNENKRLVHKCNSKHKCASSVDFKPSDSFHSSLTHKNYVTKCNDKNKQPKLFHF